MTTITDLDDFKALDPFFRIIEKGLDGIADGGHFFDLLADAVIFEYIITTPGYPRRVEGRTAVAELYRPYGTMIVLDRCHDLAVHHDIKTGVVVLEYASEGLGRGRYGPIGSFDPTSAKRDTFGGEMSVVGTRPMTGGQPPLGCAVAISGLGGALSSAKIARRTRSRKPADEMGCEFLRRRSSRSAVNASSNAGRASTNGRSRAALISSTTACSSARTVALRGSSSRKASSPTTAGGLSTASCRSRAPL